VINSIFPDDKIRTIRNSQKIIHRVGHNLVRERSKAIQEGSNLGGKDLLTLLLKSNLSTDIPIGQRISDDDMLNQISTFLFAGSDTTSLALTWTIFLLSNHQDLQTRLRTELQAISTGFDADSSVETAELFSNIDSLQCLDNVVKEGLRLIPPVHSSLRVAMKDDEIPVGEAIKMKDGAVKWSIRIKKGQFIHVPMEGFNLDKSVWGPDAWQFDPDRWNKLPDAVTSQPGIFANTMTFSAGPRACIGYKFSIMEIKIFLYVLITSFVFSDPENVYKANVVLTRPYVVNKAQQGSQCPLRVTPYPR